MGLLAAAVKTALLDRSGTFSPVLTIRWFGDPAATRQYVSAGVIDTTGVGRTEDRVVAGGWGDISRSVNERSSSTPSLSVAVSLADTDGGITALLEGGQNPRRSVVTIDWVTFSASGTARSTIFTGILDSWAQESPMLWRLGLKTDDSALRGFTPRFAIDAGISPNAPTNTKGIYLPVVYGVHNSGGLTTTGGMLKAVATSIDATTGYVYVASMGKLASINRVFKGTTLKTVTVDYTINYAYLGGRIATTINMVAATVAADVITFDCTGLTSVADGTAGTFAAAAPGGSVLTNPVEIVKHYLANFVYNDWQTGPWFSYGSVPISSAFSAAESYSDTFRHAGTLLVGGTTEQARVADVVDAWLKSYPMYRLIWTLDGKLACKILDHRWPGYISDPWIRGDQAAQSDIAGSMKYAVDASQLTRQVSLSYLWGANDGKYWSSVNLEDPSVADRVSESFALLNGSSSLV